MRGIGAWAKLWRRPLPVGALPLSPRVLSVLHIADQYAVFDQRIFAAWRALIVNAD
jgi:hypothetical protein